MIFNKYSESKDGTVVGGFVSSSSSETSSSTPPTTRGGGIDREIWGQEDDGGDVDGDLTCQGNMFIVDNYDDDEDDDEDDEYGAKTRVEVPVPFAIADELQDKFDNNEGGNLYVKRQLVVDKNIQSPDIYGKTMYLDYKNTKTNILDLILPVGSIIMFNGQSALPNGWAICDGTNGTPNLVGKFIKGVGKTSDVGSTGGSSTHTLTTNEMPSHSHSATTSINLNIQQDTATVKDDWKDKFFIGYHETYYQAFDMGGDKHYTAETGYENPTDKGISEVPIKDLLSAAGGVSGSATATTTIGNTGGGQSFNTEPPYYTLIYIMKIN